MLTQLTPANITMQYPPGNPVFFQWQPRPEYHEDHATKIIMIWGVVFGICWLPVVGLFVYLYGGKLFG